MKDLIERLGLLGIDTPDEPSVDDMAAIVRHLLTILDERVAYAAERAGQVQPIDRRN